MLHAGRLGPLTLVLAPEAGVTAGCGGEVVGVSGTLAASSAAPVVEF